MMRVDLFDFDLPPERIALRPAMPRDSAKLLWVNPNEAPQFRDYTIRDLPNLLKPGDALVFNDTKVFPAQLDGIRRRDDLAAKISFTLHKKIDEQRWIAFARPAKKIQTGDEIDFGVLKAQVTARHEGEVELSFTLAGEQLFAAFTKLGKTPLPPYIASKRDADLRDVTDYQTVFAKEEGSVAAPTAGLHFTPDLIRRLQDKKISLHYVTLHVGAGTFLPVKTDDTNNHVMHAEWGSINADTAKALNRIRADGGRIIPVGTTCLRLLESASDEEGRVKSYAGETAIFIMPGYEFRVADALITNFHLSRSTLFMLVSAFAGLEVMQKAYRHAVDRGYRFYSYGDACLLFPKAT